MKEFHILHSANVTFGQSQREIEASEATEKGPRSRPTWVEPTQRGLNGSDAALVAFYFERLAGCVCVCVCAV